jgi:polysaccharide export outer membrane protein
MKTIANYLARFSIVIALFAAPSIWGATDLAAHNKAKEEFKQAEKAASLSHANLDSAQRQIDKLTADRDTWESEVIHYKGTVSYAQSQLDHFTKLGVPADIEQWTRELADANTRLQTSENELKKVDLELQAAVQSLRNTFQEPASTDLIVPGETLDIIVAEDDTLSIPYLVRRGGYITMKGVGRIQVAGKDLDGAEKAIKARLGENQIKEASVTVERAEGKSEGTGPVVYLVGQFEHPGPYQIPNNINPTALTTILRSGGTTKSADLTRVRLLRMVGGEGLVEEINAQAILDGVGLPSDLPVNPGDIIVVPPFANVVYVTGNVGHPQTLELMPDDEITAFTAILRSGGFARFANRKKFSVVRDRGNGDKQVIPVNITDVEKGRQPDIILEPKDIVIVPEKFFSF